MSTLNDYVPEYYLFVAYYNRYKDLEKETLTFDVWHTKTDLTEEQTLDKYTT